MGLELERIVYESAATGSTDSFGNIAVILAESDRNNRRDGLTGALAAHRDRYIQVVEGTGQALDGLLRRLEDDPRHRDIVLIDRQRIDGRLFGDWRMANARVSPAQAAALDRLIEQDALTAPAVIRLLLEALRALEFENSVSGV